MPKISIIKLEPGQVLAEPATGPRGNVLIGAGVALTEKHIRALKTWGINSVSIEGAGDDTSEAAIAIPDTLLEQARELIRPRFRYVDLGHPMMSRVFDYAASRKALEIMRATS